MPVEITRPGLYDTPREIAAARGVESRTVQYWIDKGWLPALVIPSSTGQRPVVALVHRDDWQGFTPPPPGVKAHHDALEKEMERETGSLNSAYACPECGAPTAATAGVEYCLKCGWRIM